MNVVPFPSGANSSDTILGGSHINRTTLEEFEYRLFSNHTISNNTHCYLTLDEHPPGYLYPNGTWQGSSSCFVPLLPLGSRSRTAIPLAVLFGLSLVLIAPNLKKHGAMYLPREKRFTPIGRRWQWYFGFITAAVAMISLFMSIDVDRYYISQTPTVIMGFFWYLMQMVTMAMSWEVIRHWGSWQERQMIDPDPFIFKAGDKRSMIEFWMPMFFYMWFWLTFFLAIAHNWGQVAKQRSQEQIEVFAKPFVTNVRFKVSAFIFIAMWLVMIASLAHTVKYYKPKHRGFVNKVIGFFRYVPIPIHIILVLLVAMISFQIATTFNFDISPLNNEGITGAMKVGGYVPTLLVIYTMCVWGFARPNEDKELQRQRRSRNHEIDEEMGTVAKPHWWSRMTNNNHNKASVTDQISRNVNEINSGRRREAAPVLDNPGVDVAKIPSSGARGTRRNTGGIEMRNINSSPSTSTGNSPDLSNLQGAKSERLTQQQVLQSAAALLFPNQSPRAPSTTEVPHVEPSEDVPPAYTSVTTPGTEMERSESTGTPNQPQQQPRSMLD